MRILAVLLAACTPAADLAEPAPVNLVVRNQSGVDLGLVDYRRCGSDVWIQLLAEEEVLGDGEEVEAEESEADCFDVYAEDEVGCVWEGGAAGMAAEYVVEVVEVWCG